MLLFLTDHNLNSLYPKEGEEYERATKYNYKSEEKGALVEVISLIKGLQTLKLRLENVFKNSNNLKTYSKLQNFYKLSCAI